MEVKKKKLNINEIIKDVYCLMKNTAEKKEIKLYIEGENVPNIYGDNDRFKQMLINLVDNAIKYSEKSGVIKIGTYKEDE